MYGFGMKGNYKIEVTPAQMNELIPLLSSTTGDSLRTQQSKHTLHELQLECIRAERVRHYDEERAADKQ